MITKHEVLKEITVRGEKIPVGSTIHSSDYPAMIVRWMRLDYIGKGTEVKSTQPRTSVTVEPGKQLPDKREVLYLGEVLAREGEIIDKDTTFIEVTRKGEKKEKKIPKKTLRRWERYGVIDTNGKVLPFPRKSKAFGRVTKDVPKNKKRSHKS